jgi:hypothetical protein
MRATKICSDDNPCDAIPFLQRALPLARLGLRVHPLEPRHKKPLLQGYKTIATPNQAVLMAWADAYPTANIGIVVGERIIGEIATPYVVLDIDNRRYGHTSLATLEQMHPALPMTWQVQTGDGQHIYLALPEHVTVPTREQTHAMSKRPAKDLAPGIEMLTAGCNLVGPGSIHPSGHVYHWMDCYDPASVELAMMPNWLIDRGLANGVLCERRRQNSSSASSNQTPVLQRKNGTFAREAKIGEKFSSGRVVLLADSRDETDVVEDAVGLPGNLTGETVKDLLSQRWVVQRCLALLSIPHFALSGRKFRCVLHKDVHPSASLVPPRSPGEPWLYVDHHCKDEEPRTLLLPLVYFCHVTGQPTTTRLNTPELLTWSVRLLREAGVLDGAEVRAPKLPADAPDHASAVYEGFLDLLSAKWRVTPRAASPFAWRFAERWIGLHEWHVGQGMKWLLSRGYIRFVQMECGLYTFLPGTRQLIHRRKKRAHAEKQKQEAIIQDAQPDVDTFLQEGETPRHQPYTKPAAGQSQQGASDVCVDGERERRQARLLTKCRAPNICLDLTDPFDQQVVVENAG